MKKRIVVVCPGRGSYTKETLGYIKNHPHRQSGVTTKFMSQIDEWRQRLNEPTITELDEAQAFKVSLHTKGEHASPLIYASAFTDFMAIDRSRYEVVAICGNSMGWYLTLALSGALDRSGAFNVIQTMGSMMKDQIVGGQIIYPIVDEEWRIDPKKLRLCEEALEELLKSGQGEAYVSIRLGGYVVIGGDTPGLKFLLAKLPKSGDYPFQLINHAAFHTPLLSETSKRSFELLPMDLFSSPKVPVVDGRGKIWQPFAADPKELWGYTLGHQVIAPYDFTLSATVALKEFLPDHLVLLGPGNSLGGALGQILIENNWHGINSKTEFQNLQKEKPFLLSMGIEEQRKLLL